MEKISLRFVGAIIASCVLALALTIIPLPEEWSYWKPEWVAMTLVHWGLMLPKKISLVLAWCLGLLVDAIYGSILGQHALGFTLALFMTLRMRPRLMVNSFLHQQFLLVLVLGTYMLINLWILGISGNTPKGWYYWLPVLSSLIIWPAYHYFLRIFQAENKPF